MNHLLGVIHKTIRYEEALLKIGKHVQKRGVEISAPTKTESSGCC